ncbi:AMP-binding protein, partial [Methylorubrum suomiense]
MAEAAGNHLFDLVRAHLPADPSGSTFIEAVTEGRRYSYADLLTRSGAYANALVGLGVRPGDRVAVQVEKSAEVIFLYLGAVRAGAIFLPLNTAYTGAEIAYFLGDAEPALFVCDPAREADLTAVAREAGVAQIRTLGGDGHGSMAEAA